MGTLIFFRLGGDIFRLFGGNVGDENDFQSNAGDEIGEFRHANNYDNGLGT